MKRKVVAGILISVGLAVMSVLPIYCTYQIIMKACMEPIL